MSQLALRHSWLKRLSNSATATKSMLEISWIACASCLGRLRCAALGTSAARSPQFGMTPPGEAAPPHAFCWSFLKMTAKGILGPSLPCRPAALSNRPIWPAGTHPIEPIDQRADGVFMHVFKGNQPKPHNLTSIQKMPCLSQTKAHAVDPISLCRWDREGADRLLRRR